MAGGWRDLVMGDLNNGQVKAQIELLLPAIWVLMGYKKALHITALDPRDGAVMTEYSIGNRGLILKKGYDMQAHRVAEKAFKSKRKQLLNNPSAVATWTHRFVLACASDLELKKVEIIAIFLTAQITGLYYRTVQIKGFY